MIEFHRHSENLIQEKENGQSYILSIHCDWISSALLNTKKVPVRAMKNRCQKKLQKIPQDPPSDIVPRAGPNLTGKPCGMNSPA